MRVICVGLFVVALAGCSAGDGRFAGILTVTDGTCGSGFVNGTAPATLLIDGHDAQFTPSDGVVVLGGQVNGAGHVVARSDAPGADHKPFPQVFEGDRAGNDVTGVFATPRCRAAAKLTRR